MNKEVLKAHELTHNNVKNFECHLCGTYLAKARNLRNYLKIHSEEKTIECQVCCAKFRTLENLRMHQKSH